jgi:hypothetical protein
MERGEDKNRRMHDGRLANISPRRINLTEVTLVVEG